MSLFVAVEDISMPQCTFCHCWFKNRRSLATHKHKFHRNKEYQQPIKTKRKPSNSAFDDSLRVKRKPRKMVDACTQTDSSSVTAYSDSTHSPNTKHRIVTRPHWTNLRMRVIWADVSK